LKETPTSPTKAVQTTAASTLYLTICLQTPLNIQNQLRINTQTLALVDPKDYLAAQRIGRHAQALRKLSSRPLGASMEVHKHRGVEGGDLDKVQQLAESTNALILYP